MRISDRLILALAATLALAGCDRSPQKLAGKVADKVTDKVREVAGMVGGGAPAPAGEPLSCRLAGEKVFEPVCTIERSQRDGIMILTVHAPDGGFRRLKVTKDGRGVIAADGAQRAMVSIRAGNEIEVALGGDRYRLPATLKGQSATRP